MLQHPTIAIIGAEGTMGSRLLRRLLDNGYHVHAYDQRRISLDILRSGEPNLTIHTSPVDAALAADVVILAIPYAAEQALAEQVRDSLGDRIVVSLTNPLTPTLDDVLTPHDESAAEHLAAVMPHARVVKALNSLSAGAFDTPQSTRPVFDTFVASDHLDAAKIVERIIADIGFRPWYVGGLILSRTLERMSALLIGVAMRYQLQGALGWRVEQVQPDDSADV
jgi:8-hydroxy-5-deazaflavin:NADPH oxidoreductase